MRLSNVLCGVMFLLQVQGQQRISQEKCEEYTKVSNVITLLVNPKAHRVPYCSRKPLDGVENAYIREFRHQALLGWVPRNGSKVDRPIFRCGGSLISELFVLTAAHCSLFNGERPVIVRFAELDLSDDFDNQVDVDIDAVIRHPNHVFRLSYHDIALVRLKETIRFSFNIRPACLWDSEKMNFTQVVATGFGHTQFLGEMSNTLLKIWLYEMDRSICAERYEGNRKLPDGIKDHQLCYGSEFSEDTCQGDSGGPIQVLRREPDCVFHIVGVTSHGGPCGAGHAASIYTSVASHIDWIESVVWP